MLKITLKKWSEIDEEGISSIENIPSRYNNFKKIQKVLAACHLDLVNTDEFFYEILEDKKVGNHPKGRPRTLFTGAPCKVPCKAP